MAKVPCFIMFGQSNMVGANQGWPTTFANDKRFEFLNDTDARENGLAGVNMVDIYANSLAFDNGSASAANRVGWWSVPDDREFTVGAPGHEGRDVSQTLDGATPTYTGSLTRLWQYVDVPSTQGAVTGDYSYILQAGTVVSGATDVAVSGNNTLTTNTPSAWTAIPVPGSTINITGSVLGNDGAYTVTTVRANAPTDTVITVTGTGLSNGTETNLTIEMEDFITGKRKRLNHSDTSIEGPGTFGQADSIGSEFSLGWNLATNLGEEVYLCKMGVGGTVATLRNIIMDIPGRGWWHGPDANNVTESTKNTWNPAHPDSLYDILTSHYIKGDPILASAADDSSEYLNGLVNLLAAQGDEPDIQGVFVLLGESDAEEPDRAAYFEEAYRLIQKSLRAYIKDNGWTTIARAEEIPWVHAKVRSGYADADPLTGHNATAGIPLVNGAIDKLVAEDQFMESVNTDDYPFYANDPVHYTSDAMVTLGDDFYAGWLKIVEYQQRFETRDNSTVEEIIGHAKDRYELGQGSSVAQDFSEAALIDHVQRSWQAIRRRLGDSAYWLKRTEEFSWSVAVNDYLELPWQVERVLTIRHASEPERFCRPQMRGIKDNGNPTYWLPDEYRSGTFSVEYMQAWQSLSDLTDHVPMPEQHEDLLICMVVRRMATYGGKTQLAAEMRAETERLFAEVGRAAGAFERNRDDVMRTGYRNVRTKASDAGLTNRRTYR